MEKIELDLLSKDLVFKLGHKLNSDAERARFAQFLDRMDCVESWTLDNTHFNNSDCHSTNAIYSEINDIVNSKSLLVCKSFDELVDLIAYFATSKAISLVEFLGHSDPDFTMRVVELISQSDDALSIEQITLKKRLIAIHRADLLNVVFSKKRIDLINQVLADIQG